MNQAASAQPFHPLSPDFPATEWTQSLGLHGCDTTQGASLMARSSLARSRVFARNQAFYPIIDPMCAHLATLCRVALQPLRGMNSE